MVFVFVSQTKKCLLLLGIIISLLSSINYDNCLIQIRHVQGSSNLYFETLQVIDNELENYKQNELSRKKDEFSEKKNRLRGIWQESNPHDIFQQEKIEEEGKNKKYARAARKLMRESSWGVIATRGLPGHGVADGFEEVKVKKLNEDTSLSFDGTLPDLGFQVMDDEGIFGRTFPFGNIVSFSDGVSSKNATGVPCFWMTELDITPRDLKRDPRATLVISQKMSEKCKHDPEDPTCARLSISGLVRKIKHSDPHYEWAKESVFSRHPEMKNWPEDHGFEPYVMWPILNIFFLNNYGGVHPFSVHDYLKEN